MNHNKRGEIATLLTLGLVIVGAIITLSTSLFVNNQKNLASNPQAETQCVFGDWDCAVKDCNGQAGCICGKMGKGFCSPGNCQAEQGGTNDVCVPNRWDGKGGWGCWGPSSGDVCAPQASPSTSPSVPPGGGTQNCTPGTGGLNPNGKYYCCYKAYEGPFLSELPYPHYEEYNGTDCKRAVCNNLTKTTTPTCDDQKSDPNCAWYVACSKCDVEGTSIESACPLSTGAPKYCPTNLDTSSCTSMSNTGVCPADKIQECTSMLDYTKKLCCPASLKIFSPATTSLLKCVPAEPEICDDNRTQINFVTGSIDNEIIGYFKQYADCATNSNPDFTKNYTITDVKEAMCPYKGQCISQACDNSGAKISYYDTGASPTEFYNNSTCDGTVVSSEEALAYCKSSPTSQVKPNTIYINNAGSSAINDVKVNINNQDVSSNLGIININPDRSASFEYSCDLLSTDFSIIIAFKDNLNSNYSFTFEGTCRKDNSFTIKA